jgi:hypothetical protein
MQRYVAPSFVIFVPIFVVFVPIFVVFVINLSLCCDTPS